MQLINYTEKWFEEWDKFILSSKNGSIFHTRKFLSYHPEDKWNDCSVLFLNKDKKIVAVFPACRIENTIISHQGSTSGGLIVAKKNTISTSINLFKQLIDHYGLQNIYFRKHEYIFDSNPSQEVEFAAQKLGFIQEYNELSTCINLQIEPNYSSNTKSKIKRSSGKINIVFDDDNYNEFYDLLSKNLNDKHKTTSTHSLKELKKLKELLPENYYLVSAYHEKKLIASVWLLKANNNCLHTFYIALNYEHKSLYPLYSLFDYIIELGKKERFNYLNFGISTEEKGTIINNGLFNFKEAFGGFGIIRTMYCFNKN